MTGMPRAARPFVDFASLLRRHGFAIGSDQTAAFLEAVGLLGPRDMGDIHRAATATLAPSFERRPEFDALFRHHFHGQSLAATDESGEPDEEVRIQEERGGALEPPDLADEHPSGERATRAEVPGARSFAPVGEAEVLRRFRRRAAEALPRRVSRRRAPARDGDAWSLRRALRDAVRRDGEVLSLPRLRRKLRQRRVLLLIDVSGSMKAHTDDALRFAHALAGASERLEVFTIGTRLTRITRAMRLRSREQALAAASATVADWDGGTRIGDALQAFLAVPRYSSFARGALVLVVSDGLERGDLIAMTEAVRTLGRLAWKVVWLTPLAGEPGFVPRTEAMQAILPHVAGIGDASSLERLCEAVLMAGRARAA